MQLFQINQSARSSKITINAYTTIGQLHQQSITSAAHYNRIYSTYLSLPDIHHPSGHVPELLRGSAAGQREGEVQLPGRGLAAADLPAAAGGGAAARAPAYCTLYCILYCTLYRCRCPRTCGTTASSTSAPTSGSRSGATTSSATSTPTITSLS